MPYEFADYDTQQKKLDSCHQKQLHFNEIIKTIDWNGHKLTLKTGKIARQANGAVMAQLGDTIVLCTVVTAKEIKADQLFLPLTVHYREMSYAGGKIPGGFIKREGKPSDHEVLTSRLIDRSIRPLFHPDFCQETQVICTVLSHDNNCPSDIAAIIGTSAAIAISGIPFLSILAAVKVGYIGQRFIANPSLDQFKNSQLDLIVGGNNDGITMVEAAAAELPEQEVLKALEFGYQNFQPVIKLIEALKAEIAKPLIEVRINPDHSSLVNYIKEHYYELINKGFAINEKQLRENYFTQLTAEISNNIAIKPQVSLQTSLFHALDEAKSNILRDIILRHNIRIGGRKLTEIRGIDCEVSIFPKTHGSAVFTRGETQAIAVATLGTSGDEQIVDVLSGEYRERFLLHYIFPPYSVGEATPFRAPGRREIGHGRLSHKALYAVLPTKEDFPYTIRVVSEITESNGSSSMATVCATTLSLLDAGVPLKSMVAGIAMGSIKEGENFAILSDILGDEDHLGDMDFKVAGTKEGITALQMDIKIGGIDFNIMEQALMEAKRGRLHILQEMNKVVSTHRLMVSKYAPSIKIIKVNKDRLRDLIGPGGKVIKDICEKTGAKIDINDDGSVQVAALGAEKIQQAINMIIAIAGDLEIGSIFNGTVVKIIESGMFINFLSSRDGFVHISEITDHRIDDINRYAKIGQGVVVKVIGFDNRGKVRLSMKNISPPDGSKDDESNSNIKTSTPSSKLPINEQEEREESASGKATDIKMKGKRPKESINENKKASTPARKYFS